VIGNPTWKKTWRNIPNFAVIPSFGKFTSAIQVFKAKIPLRVTARVPGFSKDAIEAPKFKTTPR
jgi:HSP20 family molecular chaperone IbpA